MATCELVICDIYTEYRHGLLLMHRHFPKCVLESAEGSIRLVTWEITSDRAAHLKVTEGAVMPDDTTTSIPVKVIPLVRECSTKT